MRMPDGRFEYVDRELFLGAISRGFKASEIARESITVIRHESPDNHGHKMLSVAKFKC